MRGKLSEVCWNEHYLEPWYTARGLINLACIGGVCRGIPKVCML